MPQVALVTCNFDRHVSTSLCIIFTVITICHHLPPLPHNNRSKFDDVVTYVSKQPGFRSNEAAESARQLIESFNLEHKLALDLGQVPEHSYIERFEGAQLANLCITDVDEAFTLVPSLKDRFHDPKPLQLLLDKIQAYRP